MSRHHLGTLLLIGCTMLAGCGGSYDAPIATEPAPAEAGAAPAAGGVAADPAPVPADGEQAAPAEDAAPPEPEMVREIAKAGVGKKGRFEGEGLIVTPLKTYFLAKDKITFDIQIGSAMQLYKGEHGNAPKSHDEFMEKIVKQNQIVLPELPEGHRYVYDPEQEQLMVEHPQ